MRSIKDKFLDKCIPEPMSGCWLWNICSDGNSYGSFKYGDKYIGAHRASYLIFNGDIPDNLIIMHKCDNKCCVNPDHLEVGTHKKNINDAYKRGLNPIYKKKYCEYGHAMTKENTYANPKNGHRECRKCRYDRQVERRSKKVRNRPENYTPIKTQGEIHGMTKLTNEDVIYIRSQKSGRKLLADRFGIHISTVDRIRKGVSWKHLKQGENK